MGLVIAPESELGKELARWERPYRFEKFPQMVYRAIRHEGISVVIGSEAINRQTQKVVRDEHELQAAHEAGWRDNPQEALEFLKARELKDQRGVAERNYADRNMSEAAKAEAAQHDEDTGIDHVPEVKPRKKGRRRIEDE